MEKELPIFVITLEGSEARRASLLASLSERGLSHEILIGVDGRHGLSTEAAARVDRATAERNMFRPMLDAEFACALSHQRVYAQMLELGLESAIVLEDDAILEPGFREALNAFDPGQMDLLLLDHMNTYVTGDTISGPASSIFHRVALPPFLATGYALSARAARFLRDKGLPITRTADWPCDISRLNCFAAWPRPVGHADDPGQSLIGEAGRQRFTGRYRRFARVRYWRRVWRKLRARRIA